MSLVPAKCTQCGANLDVDSSQEAAVCPHCDTPFITEKAINNYNTTNVTNIDTINAEVINVESSDSATNLARTAETLVNFGEWDKAREIYGRITQMYPYDWRGWYGLLQTNTHNFELYFEGCQEYSDLVGLYERLLAVTDNSLPIVSSVKEYLAITHEKVKTTLSNNYKRDQQFLETKIAEENAQIKNDIACELQDERSFGSKITKVIWCAWVVIAFLITLISSINTVTTGVDLDIRFGFIRFENMDSFWDIILFTSVFMLMLQILISLILCIIGVINLNAQKHSKYKQITIFKFITKYSIIATLSHLIYWLITIMVVSANDPGYFFSYSGTYRYIDTVLFNAKVTETGACWIALLLIIIYSVLNYILVAAPLFATERLGDKKRDAILCNIKHQQEVAWLMERKKSLSSHYDEDTLKIEAIKRKYTNK